MTTKRIHSEILGVYEAYRGWRPLIDRLIEAAGPHDLADLSCKEKWGGLDFGMFRAIHLDDLIGELEELSLEICEICDAPAYQSEKSGWRRTVCKKHDDGR